MIWSVDFLCLIPVFLSPIQFFYTGHELSRDGIQSTKNLHQIFLKVLIYNESGGRIRNNVNFTIKIATKITSVHATAQIPC